MTISDCTHAVRVRRVVHPLFRTCAVSEYITISGTVTISDRHTSTYILSFQENIKLRERGMYGNASRSSAILIPLNFIAPHQSKVGVYFDEGLQLKTGQ